MHVTNLPITFISGSISRLFAPTFTETRSKVSSAKLVKATRVRQNSTASGPTTRTLRIVRKMYISRALASGAFCSPLPTASAVRPCARLNSGRRSTPQPRPHSTGESGLTHPDAGSNRSRRRSIRLSVTIMKRIMLVTLGVIAGFHGANLEAAEQAGTSSDQVPAADLKVFNDPTILTRRVWLETEWNKFTDGASIVEETAGTLWVWRVSENQDWAVRLKLPVNLRVGSDDPNVPDIGGLGDVKVATGTAFRLRKTFRVGAGLDLEMPTGRHEFSDNAWQIQGFGSLGWDITRWLTFSPSFEYNQSVAEEGSAQPLNSLETFFPFTIILPHKWAMTAGYENKTDFENDNYVTNKAKIAIAKELESIPLRFYLQTKRDFDSVEKEFQVSFVVTGYFR